MAANNLQASVNTTGQISLTTTNNAASFNIGAIGGTATDPGAAFAGVSVVNTVVGCRLASHPRQPGEAVQRHPGQITSTAQDASFNGVNLLAGDQLKLTFNETGKSTLNITGVNFNAAGLGLANPRERHRLHRQRRDQQGHLPT